MVRKIGVCVQWCVTSFGGVFARGDNPHAPCESGRDDRLGVVVVAALAWGQAEPLERAREGGADVDQCLP